MDDNLIYYLILGAIYVISKVLKKKKAPTPIATPVGKKDSEENTNEPIPQPPPYKPISFKDILHEISHEFEPKKKPKKVVQTLKPEVIGEYKPEESFEGDRRYAKKKRVRVSARKKEERLFKLPKGENEENLQDVLELLNEEGGAANAFIFSEILNKRY